MSRSSLIVPLTVCVCIGSFLGSGRTVRAHVVAKEPLQAGEQRYGSDNPGPVGIGFGVEPPAAGTTKFSCQVGVRSLVTGEGILRESFPAEAGKETKFHKSSQGLDVDVEVTIAPGGSSLSYSITVSTKTHTPVGIYSASLKLRG